MLDAKLAFIFTPQAYSLNCVLLRWVAVSLYKATGAVSNDWKAPLEKPV